MMADVVLDASAVLAFVKDEPGAERVLTHLGGAAISAVNLQEVAANLFRDGLALATIQEILGELRLDIHDHDATAAYGSAALVQQTSRYGRGLGDRSCMALGLALGLPVLTADREWGRVTIDGLSIQHLR